MTKIKYPNKINFQETAETLVFIFRFMGINGEIDPESCQRVTNKLNKYNPRKDRPWTHSYIRNIYNGKQPPSRYTAPAIDKLYQRLVKPPNPPRKRYRKIIEANNKEQLNQWNTLTAEQLRHALDRETILRRIK